MLQLVTTLCDEWNMQS